MLLLKNIAKIIFPLRRAFNSPPPPPILNVPLLRFPNRNSEWTPIPDFIFRFGNRFRFPIRKLEKSTSTEAFGQNPEIFGHKSEIFDHQSRNFWPKSRN